MAVELFGNDSLSQMLSSYFPPFHAMLHRQRVSWFAIPILVVLAQLFSGCEKTTSSVIDSSGNSPLLSLVHVTPDSINLTNLPEGVPGVSFIITANVTPANGTSQIAGVDASLAADGNTEPLAVGKLFDDGTIPDQIRGDGIFSATLTIDRQVLLVGKYNCTVSASDPHGYSSIAAILPIAITQVNYPPLLANLQAPDTIALGGQPQQFRLTVKATDPNGVSDISKVFFNSFKPNGTASGGNPFSMYDDGGIGSTSGDAVKGDGIYTLTITISPTDQQENPTALGPYSFEFQALDRSNALSQKITHSIQVVQ